MTDQNRSKIIEDFPIGNGLDVFRASFGSICDGSSILRSPDALDELGREDIQTLTLDLLSALQSLRASRLLCSAGRDRNLYGDLLRLNSAVNSCEFDVDRIKPLLNVALADKPDDSLIWNRNTSGLVNSSESRQNVDPILKLELEHVYVGLPNFHEAFFGDVPDLDMVSEAVFRRCTEGDNPLFKDGWSGWPAGAKESDVLTWFAARRKLLAQPRTPLVGSTGKRSMDIGFVNDDITYDPNSEDSRYRWSHILVAGELKSTRRFVLGFTLCGSLMRVWEFDRLGGIASEQFDINKKHGALQFATAILGFLRMNKEMLGFDPTIIASGGQQYIEIERIGKTERLIIDDVMKRARCIAGRATTCWRAHRKEDPKTPLVIKDSWQYTDRDEEGILVQEATEKGVINVARYYHHETVRVRDAEDDVQSNVRKGLDLTKATNYRSGRAMLPSGAGASRVSHKGRSSGTGMKRPSSETGAALPLSKRSGSTSPVKASVEALPNRVHRRVILRDYGKPIYKASCRVALLATLEGCLEGHQSLHKAGFLHRDISINNLMINEDKDNRSWPSFLIDLDLAIKQQRDGASGAQGKTGTRAFMAIGALLGEQHTFMHDLESFFWVLFWICIHYDAQGNGIGPTGLDDWNYENNDKLVAAKKGEIADEEDFLNKAHRNFTPYYRPLIPWVNRLRRRVFPGGGRWKRLEPELYSSMKEILREAQKDPEVLAER
ncbi:kinase [Hirsutella rhossiliensis]|uniref:non-specific serine/threonine protein kinase n=1 Tax=Hirsutella rhossiliensis TaxID=111463 RepID=A0A9P8SFH4_9HYPO|nr:kinase [Hirsutella rhossiliensis]KAH0959016.1 kinase [Hirsutella rhossiliensis]